MTEIFLSYSHKDEPVAERLAVHLNALGLKILAFRDVELIDDGLDYLRECRSICVLYSANSRITHSVRLARRMSKRSVAGLVLIDEDWDADANSLDVFSSFSCHRSRFDYLSMTRTLRTLVRIWARSGAPSQALEEDFRALAADPQLQPQDKSRLSSQRLSTGINPISGRHASTEDLIRDLRAVLHVDLSAGANRSPIISSLLAQVGQNQTGRRLWKPPGDPPDDYALGGMRALLQAIDARQPRAIAPPVQPGDSAGGAADLGGHDGGSAPPTPPTPTTD